MKKIKKIGGGRPWPLPLPTSAAANGIRTYLLLLQIPNAIDV